MRSNRFAKFMGLFLALSLCLTLAACGNSPVTDGASLIQRMERQRGVHALEHGEEIGLGSRAYELVNLDG